MKDYIIKTKTVVGKRNYDEGNGNQDSIKVYEDEKVIIVCVNDGCTGCDYPQKACDVNSKVAISLGRDPAIFEVQEKKFKQLAKDTYKEMFDETGVPIDELSATTAFVIVNKKTKQFLAFSVGDTAILSYNSDMRVSVMLAPKNGFMKSITNFTNDDYSVRKLSQYKRGIIDDKFTGFIIYSDGAENIFNESSNQAKSLINACYISDEAYAQEEEKVFNMLRKLTKDDISIAILVSANEKIINKVNEKEDSNTESEIFSKDVPIDSKEHSYTTQNEKFDTNSLLRFMKRERGIDELVDSGIIKEDDALKTLVLLLKMGIISCNNNKFKTI